MRGNYRKEVRSYVLLLPKSFILAEIVFPRACDIAFWKLAVRRVVIKNFLPLFPPKQETETGVVSHEREREGGFSGIS